MSTDQAKRCRACGGSVVATSEQFDVFEQMHYVCFHYEFEHGQVDRDEECYAGGCPSAAVNARPDRRPVETLRQSGALPPVVFIDPDELLSDSLFVVVERATGVWYQQQYGGTTCRQAKVEGYLVPVGSRSAEGLNQALLALREVFERDLAGAGVRGNFEWKADLLVRIEQAVAQIGFARSEDFGTTEAMTLDLSRKSSMDEAWVPVVTADGPGWLLWQNSD